MNQELLFPVESFNSAVDIFRRNLADVFQCRNQIFDFAVNVCDFLLIFQGEGIRIIKIPGYCGFGKMGICPEPGKEILPVPACTMEYFPERRES